MPTSGVSAPTARRGLWRLVDLPILATLAQLWPFLKAERRRLLLNAAVTLALTCSEVATPLLVGMFLDALLAGLGGTVATVAPALNQRTIIGLLLIAALLRGFLVSQQLALAGHSGEQVAARIRNAVWCHLQRLPLDYTRRRGSGRILVRFIGDTRAIQRLVTQGIVRLSQDLLLAVAVLVVLLTLNWRLGSVVVLILPAYAALFWWLNPKLRRESRKRRSRSSRLSAYLQERITGMAVVKAYIQQPAEANQVRELNRQLSRRGVRRAKISGQLQGLAGMSVAGNTALVLWLASSEVAAGRLTAGTLVSFYALISMLAPVFQRVVQANRYFQEAQISVDRLTAMLAEQPESPLDDDRPPLTVTNGTISVTNLSFSYGADQAALSDISFVARRGELIALVGPNGAGKSTLLELLLQFRQPNAGSIMIDEQNIAEVALTSLRSHIGLVSQDAPLFDGTIAENIAYGVADDLPREQIERASRLAGVDAFVATLPEGWGTQIGSGGRVLSGGQRQRVALARALALDPPILVLDEATSALDSEVERELAITLRELARHKTVLVSAHRIETFRVADRIYVLDRGRIVEAGVHDELLARGGLYMRLFGAHEGAASPAVTQAVEA